jgi:hypothetical protein
MKAPIQRNEPTHSRAQSRAIGGKLGCPRLNLLLTEYQANSGTDDSWDCRRFNFRIILSSALRKYPAF